ERAEFVPQAQVERPFREGSPGDPRRLLRNWSPWGRMQRHQSFPSCSASVPRTAPILDQPAAPITSPGATLTCAIRRWDSPATSSTGEKNYGGKLDWTEQAPRR